MEEKDKEKIIIKFCISLVAIIIGVYILALSHKGLKTNEYFTIEKSVGNSWQLSELSLPDTTITDTVSTDGIITYHTTQYIRVLKK